MDYTTAADILRKSARHDEALATLKLLEAAELLGNANGELAELAKQKQAFEAELSALTEKIEKEEDRLIENAVTAEKENAERMRYMEREYSEKLSSAEEFYRQKLEDFNAKIKILNENISSLTDERNALELQVEQLQEAKTELTSDIAEMKALATKIVN